MTSAVPRVAVPISRPGCRLHPAKEVGVGGLDVGARPAFPRVTQDGTRLSMRTTMSGARDLIFPPCTYPGLSSCLEERRLTLGGIPLHLSCLDVEALRAVEWAIAGRRSVLLVPADPLAPLSALIPAAVHVASFMEGVRSLGFAAGSSRRVAVVSGDYQLRGLYRGLGISAGRGMGSALLRDVVPAATLGHGGVVHVLGAEGHDGRWSTLFVPTVDDVLNMKDVDLVVVELPAAGEEHIPVLGVPVVAVARDIAARSVARLAQEMPVIAWNPADIAGCEPGGLTPTLERLARGGTCDIITVEQAGICDNAGLFWDDIGALVAAGRSALVRDLALQAFGLFHDLLGLALPLAAYDSLSPTPAGVRVRALGHAARVTKGEIRDLYLPMVEAELRGLLDSMGAEPAKYAALRRVVARNLDDGLDTLLVARTAALAHAYKVVLGQAGLAKVRVTSLGALRGEIPADVAVLTGMAPAWARWVYRCGIAQNVQVLAYDPRGAASFSEAARVRSVVDTQARVLAELSAPEVRAAAVLSLDRVPRPSGRPYQRGGRPARTSGRRPADGRRAPRAVGGRVAAAGRPRHAWRCQPRLAQRVRGGRGRARVLLRRYVGAPGRHGRGDEVAAEQRRAGSRRTRVRPTRRRRAGIPGRRCAQGPGVQGA